MTEADPFAFAVKIGALLDEMGIPYLVGGSVASMMYGEPRYTRDLDLVIDTDERGARTLAEHLQDEFYIDVEGAAEAVRERSVFSAIHIETFLRVDFFTIGDFHAARREQLARGRVIAVSNGVARFCSPEDIIVQNLLWYRMGGHVSEQQWRDVVGVLRVSTGLDHVYLDRAADAFDVRDLLELARQDADN
jgi:hypothetical protein